ncbi:N-acetylmuramoyl-L-alanine amidase [Terrabacter carboxydivorans]|uniref:N-acetylmuramoyl-L-alanine amidase n=1 Tax=Terrabacter carboxydivorans TaxID=619730 RepID=A0ABN3LRK3_9MICO
MRAHPRSLLPALVVALSALVASGATPAAAEPAAHATRVGPTGLLPAAPAPAAAPVRPRVTSFAIPDVAAGQASSAPGTSASKGRRVVAQSQHTGVAFDVAGVTFTGRAPADLEVQVRTRARSTWTGWMDLEVDPQDGPDPGSAEGRRSRSGTEAVTAADSDGIEVRVLTAAATPKGLALAVVDAGTSPADATIGAVGDPAGTGVDPASSSTAGAGDRAAPSTVDASTAAASTTTAPTTTAASTTAAATAAAAASVPRPAIISRAQWGADDSLMPCQPQHLAGFKAAVVHHTVNANTYTSAEAASLMRGIFAFHTQSRGWCDIGYNFLVDRFGRIYEGRKGGLSGFTLGAQAGGFNQETFGVSVIGDFTSVPFPSAVRTAVARVVAWQADRSAFDPSASVTLTSGGSTRYAPGVRVTKPRVMGHRDLSLTDCPGDAAYPQVPGIRSAAASEWRAGQYSGRANRFTPVTARRVVDTRSGVGAPRAKLAAGGSITFRPSGMPADVSAVAVNVTTTGATRLTSVGLVPAGVEPRSASVLNTGPGRTTAAAVTVGVGSGGAVTLRSSSGSVDVIVDLAGYYSNGSANGLAGSFRRVLDTRSGLGAPARRVEPSRPLTLTVANLPAGTRAVNLNLTVTGPQGAGHLTAYAGGSARPSTSNVNFLTGQDVANLATVPVGPGGTVTIHSTAPTHVVADVMGVFVAGTGSRFTPVSPRRVLDTRYGWGAPYGPLVAGRTLTATVAGIPATANGVAMSLSATSATQPTSLTVYAAGTSRPGTSNVNVVPGQAVSALVVSGIRGSAVSVSSAVGSVSVIGDLMGYYAG